MVDLFFRLTPPAAHYEILLTYLKTSEALIIRASECYSIDFLKKPSQLFWRH